MNNYLFFEENKVGRDFIVGDIHGCFDTLDSALAKIEFDETADRLFSIGDLIDRGPQSEECLKFMKRPNVHVIRGNHEDIYLDLFQNGGLDFGKAIANIRNGMDWVLETANHNLPLLKEIRDEFAKLPVAIEIATSRGSVGLVHADIPENMDWRCFVDNISMNNEDVIQEAIWGRKRVLSENDTGVQGIDRLFFGHTPQEEGVKRLGNCYYIDTGAVFDHISNQHNETASGFHLTVGDIKGQTITYEQAGAQTDEDNTILTVPPEGTPFGKYTR